MKTYEDCKKEVAQKYKLGKTLVIGHLPKYYQEAAMLFAESQLKEKMFTLQDMEKCWYQAWLLRERYDELIPPPKMDYEETVHYYFNEFIKNHSPKNT